MSDEDTSHTGNEPIYAARVVEQLALVGEVDAWKWAATFVAAQRENPMIATDPATMVAWFSTAIMAGYDQGHLTALRNVFDPPRP